MTNQKVVENVRLLAHTQKSGILSTLSAEMEGWPFGSVAPCVLDQMGHPILFLSDLAQHTHNLMRDGRASLIVFDQKGADVQEAARATFMGRVSLVGTDDPMRDRYLRYHPQAVQYIAIHDFRFYRLRVEQVRYIGGFGDVHWVPGEDYEWQGDTDALAFAESEAVAHMNEDHKDALVTYCHILGVEEPHPILLGVDAEGFDLQTDSGRLRMLFKTPVNSPEEWRAAFKALLEP